MAFRSNFVNSATKPNGPLINPQLSSANRTPRVKETNKTTLAPDIRKRAELEVDTKNTEISAISGQNENIVDNMISGAGKPITSLGIENFLDYSAPWQSFGVDLSHIRLHDDAAAREAAKKQGANAFSYGDHIVLGEKAQQDTPEAQKIVAHEVTHAAQQAKPGSAKALLKDSPDGEGIGREPPSGNFVRNEGTGAEDGHILFENDSAGLSAQMQASIQQLIGDMSEPLTIHLHGYADPSGNSDYNFNLSAHRAVAVKNYLESILPEGSRVIAFAYGETSEFGAEAQGNRRVGIDVVQRGNPRPLGSSLSLVPNLSLSPSLMPGGLPGGLNLATPGIPTTPSLAPRLQPEPGTPQFNILPRTVSPFANHPFQAGDIASLYAQRGLSFSVRDMQSFEQHFIFWRDTFFRLGLNPEQAVWAAQVGANAAASTMLSLEHPTAQESLDRAMDTTPTIVPVTPALEWAIGVILNNDEFNMTRF